MAKLRWRGYECGYGVKCELDLAVALTRDAEKLASFLDSITLHNNDLRRRRAASEIQHHALKLPGAYMAI